MEYVEELHNFESFNSNWSKENEYILFGKSKECFQFIRTIDHLLGDKALKIKGIMDFEQNTVKSESSLQTIFPYYFNAKYNKQQKQSKRNLTLMPVDGFDNSSNVKIILTSDMYRQQSIKFLKKLGLKEDIDYCIYKKILGIWPLKYKNISHIYRVDQTLTTKCTLDCTYCNMFMPYYKKQKHMPVKQLISDQDVFLDLVDYISSYHLIGGEPFLYPDIDEIISNIGENYREKIDNFILTSNGTCIPKKSTLMLLKKYDVYVTISNYTKSLPGITNRVNKVIDKLHNSGVYHVVRIVDEWVDFGDARVQKYFDDEQLINHFNKCTVLYRGLTNNRFYYCNLSMSADASGIHAAEEGDYISLDKIKSKEELIKFDLGFTGKGYISLCKTCSGCNTGIEIPVTPKEQGLRKIQ